MKPACLLIAIAAVTSCAPPSSPGASGSSTSPASLASTARVERTQTPSATAALTPLPSQSADTQPTGVRANALGRLTGNWLFVGKQVPGALNVRAEVQIWAIPLDGGTPKFAFGYMVSLGGAPEGIFDNTPYLRRQFSPDGTRMVVSVEGRLVVVDLVTGQSKHLGVSGYLPSWSKDGSRIAFLFQVPVASVVPEDAIGVMPAGGGPVRQMTLVGYARNSVEWSADGSMFVIAQPDGLAIVDASSARVIRRIAEVSQAGSSFAHWRAKTPQVAIAVTGCEQATARLIALDTAVSAPRTLLDTGERCAPLNIRDPRWNPVGEEILYVSARAQGGIEATEFRTHLVDLATGTDRVLPLIAWEATWTWDGSAVAYVAKGPASVYGNAVRVWRRDGSGERELLRAAERDSFFSVASLSY